MHVTVSKLVSLLIAIVQFVGAIVVGGIDANLIRVAMGLLFVLSLIWFPDEIGTFTSGRVYPETPGVIVAGFGWFFLVGMPLLVLFLIS